MKRLEKTLMTVAAFGLLVFSASSCRMLDGDCGSDCGADCESCMEAAEHPEGGEHPAGSEHPAGGGSEHPDHPQD